MKKILFAALFVSSLMLASCSKKQEVKTSYFDRYKSVFSAKSTLGNAD